MPRPSASLLVAPDKSTPSTAHARHRGVACVGWCALTGSCVESGASQSMNLIPCAGGRAASPRECVPAHDLGMCCGVLRTQRKRESACMNILVRCLRCRRHSKSSEHAHMHEHAHEHAHEHESMNMSKHSRFMQQCSMRPAPRSLACLANAATPCLDEVARVTCAQYGPERLLRFSTSSRRLQPAHTHLLSRRRRRKHIEQRVEHNSTQRTSTRASRFSLLASPTRPPATLLARRARPRCSSKDCNHL